MNRKEITERLVAAIEGGNIPWRQPFASFAHKNHFSKAIYRGINQLLLSLNVDASPHWGTFLQWKNAGCCVRKGAKASPVVFYANIEKTDDDGEEFSFRLLRHYPVFHVGQVDDPKGKFKNILEMKIETNFETAARIIDRCGADIRIGGNLAFYVPSENYIRIPHSGQFHSEEARLATIFHELGHWGDRNFLERKPMLDKKSSENAFDELIAEIAACFLCRACGVPTEWENHESYIASWLRAMKNDTAYILEASRHAAKITDTILQRAGLKVDSETDST
jgi:antirestriction protein ArdC